MYNLEHVMLSASLFERAIAWLASEAHAGDLQHARSEFEKHTGPIVSGADYEARIAHFLEQALCEPTFAEQPAAISVFAAETALSEDERRELAGWLRSHRSLFRFEVVEGQTGRVLDRIGGARFEFRVSGADRELRAGDCFDGRIVTVGDTLFLSPGRVFHPQEAWLALDVLLAEAREHALLDRSLLNPLLRMRSRFVGFESIRAEHVYRLDALHAESAGAPWAQSAKRAKRQ